MRVEGLLAFFDLVEEVGSEGGLFAILLATKSDLFCLEACSNLFFLLGSILVRWDPKVM